MSLVAILHQVYKLVFAAIIDLLARVHGFAQHIFKAPGRSKLAEMPKRVAKFYPNFRKLVCISLPWVGTHLPAKF